MTFSGFPSFKLLFFPPNNLTFNTSHWWSIPEPFHHRGYTSCPQPFDFVLPSRNSRPQPLLFQSTPTSVHNVNCLPPTIMTTQRRNWTRIRNALCCPVSRNAPESVKIASTSGNISIWKWRVGHVSESSRGAERAAIVGERRGGGDWGTWLSAGPRNVVSVCVCVFNHQGEFINENCF